MGFREISIYVRGNFPIERGRSLSLGEREGKREGKRERRIEGEREERGREGERERGREGEGGGK